MGKLVLFMHVSLDGFTARKGGGMDWIKMDDDMFEYAHIRIGMSDTALYGRNTYELMDAYWPNAADQPNASKHDIEHSTWYNKVNKYVVSETMKGRQIDKVKIISSSVPDVISELKKQTSGEIIMFGSPSLAGSLMNENLIDDYWIFINPIILGEGNSLFNRNKKELNLTLIKHIPFSNGVVCLNYTKK